MVIMYVPKIVSSAREVNSSLKILNNVEKPVVV